MNADLTPAARAALTSFVADGGSILQASNEQGNTSLPNALFGYSLVSRGHIGATTLDAGAAASTPFVDGPANLPDSDAVQAVSSASLPDGALNLYRIGNETSVFATAFGLGRYVYVGFDWYERPTPTAWQDVMGKAIDFATNTVVSCEGLTPTITGTIGDDLLIGTDGDDVIVGLSGDDVIYGNGGDDVICGGLGNDFLWGGTGRDRLFGESGDDVLRGSTGGDYLAGGSGRDLLLGGRGNDRLLGKDGDDVLFGGDGADRLLGGPGRDTLFGGAGEDRLFGGRDNDSLYGDTGDDALQGQQGSDICDGGPADTMDTADASCETVLDVP